MAVPGQPPTESTKKPAQPWFTTIDTDSSSAAGKRVQQLVVTLIGGTQGRQVP